jgi:hypothetical protein
VFRIQLGRSWGDADFGDPAHVRHEEGTRA